MKLWMILVSSVYISDFSKFGKWFGKFGTMIIGKLKNYLRGYIYFSFLYNSYWHQQNKKIQATKEDSSMNVEESKTRISWHREPLTYCISLDWILMPIALMEWNQNGMNNTLLAPIDVTMLQADGK